MPGGDPEAWPLLRPLLEAIAARTKSGEPCAAWMGPGGAGHFVKMVHNAIEYADMELIAETYHLLRGYVRASHDEMRTVFAEWNKTELSSYLVAITADVLGVMDEDGEPLVEKVLDAAGQKGTGAWAAEAALELGSPAGLLAEAVFARDLSALKDERVGASAVLGGPKAAPTGERHAMIEDLRKALLAAKIVAYAQGFQLLRRASAERGWGLDLASVALVWREGCIIRSAFLERIAEAYRRESGLPNLVVDSYFKALLDQCMPSLRRVTARAVESGAPVPAFSAAVSFYDGYRSTWLPANLLQALRDRFGAHGYERVDRPRGESFHSEWK
jgi:6-phosphogluconate dehydrogenase